MILKHVCTILIALVVASPAIAQDGPIGIAFAEAPEQSSGGLHRTKHRQDTRLRAAEVR
jgi:hypothetical protein